MNFSTKPAACGETAPQKREQLQEKTVKLTFLGHACFLVQAGAHTLILDPFLTNSRTAAMRAADVEATHMLISHAHGDHIGDAAPIAERCGCTVFCTPETGAMRSLFPLPTTRRYPSSSRTSPRSSPTASLARRPQPYSTSRMAWSRNARGVQS